MTRVFFYEAGTKRQNKIPGTRCACSGLRDGSAWIDGTAIGAVRWGGSDRMDSGLWCNTVVIASPEARISLR